MPNPFAYLIYLQVYDIAKADLVSSFIDESRLKGYICPIFRAVRLFLVFRNYFMKNATFRWLLPLFFLPLIACGQQDNASPNNAESSQVAVKKSDSATETKIKKAFEDAYKEQKIQVKSVSPTPVAGIYELVLSGSQIVYVDANANYFFAGELIDLHAKKSLTEERMQEANAVDFSKLPLDSAIKEVRGKGTLKVAVFSDPDCTYCKELEKVFTEIDNVTVYTFLMPIESLHPNAKKKAIQIWCSKNPTQTWINWMRKGIAPTGVGTCKNPVQATMVLGDSLGFTGTPTLVLPNGMTQAGFAPKEVLLELLKNNQK